MVLQTYCFKKNFPRPRTEFQDDMFLSGAKAISCKILPCVHRPYWHKGSFWFQWSHLNMKSLHHPSLLPKCQAPQGGLELGHDPSPTWQDWSQAMPPSFCTTGLGLCYVPCGAEPCPLPSAQPGWGWAMPSSVVQLDQDWVPPLSCGQMGPCQIWPAEGLGTGHLGP